MQRPDLTSTDSRPLEPRDAVTRALRLVHSATAAVLIEAVAGDGQYDRLTLMRTLAALEADGRIARSSRAGHQALLSLAERQDGQPLRRLRLVPTHPALQRYHSAARLGRSAPTDAA